MIRTVFLIIVMAAVSGCSETEKMLLVCSEDQKKANVIVSHKNWIGGYVGIYGSNLEIKSYDDRQIKAGGYPSSWNVTIDRVDKTIFLTMYEFDFKNNKILYDKSSYFNGKCERAERSF